MSVRNDRLTTLILLKIQSSPIVKTMGISDEMNIHVPQNMEAAYELTSLAAVPTQIISPASGKPIIGAKQDSLLGCYILTRDGMRLKRRHLMNYLMPIKNFTGIMPEPFENKDAGINSLYTGQQVYSSVLPRLSYNRELDVGNKKTKVVIRNGELVSGILTKDIVGAGSSLIKNIYNILGIKPCSDYLNDSQQLIMRFLADYGYSIGIGDGIPHQEILDKVRDDTYKALQESHALIQKVHGGVFKPELGNELIQKSFESEITTILNSATDSIGKFVLGNMCRDNRFHIAITSKSKGNSTNIAQIMGIVGQTMVEGERVPMGYTYRTVPHYHKFDQGAMARGFVIHSFMEGLSPIEYFFHAMGARIGLIDTAVKTARSGYIQRKLVKSTEDGRVHYDGTVRNPTNTIIQFAYGDDCIDARKLEKSKLITVPMDNRQLEDRYKFDSKFMWKSVLKKKAINEMKKTENWQQILDDEYMRIREDRDKTRRINEPYLTMMEDIGIDTPIDPKTLRDSAINEFHITADELSDLNPIYVSQQIEKLISELQMHNHDVTFYTKVIVRSFFATKRIICEYHLNKLAFDFLVERIRNVFNSALVHPGEMVGPLAAQSIGEPSTQITLNTFHLAGVGGKSIVTTKGVPRIEEIISVTQKIKTPSMTIRLKPEYAQNESIAQKVKTDIIYTTIGDLMVKSDFLSESKTVMTSFQEDLEFINTYLEFNKLLKVTDTQSNTHKSPWVIRMEFSKEELLNRNVQLIDIQNSILREVGSEGEIECIFNDDNARNLIVRIKLRQDDLNDNSHVDAIRELERQITMMTFRGIPGIVSADVRKEKRIIYLDDGSYQTIEEYVIDTDGTNLLEILKNEYVDSRRTKSNDIVEIYQLFGIEAGRNAIINEMNEILAEYGTESRHISLLADYMTYKGVIASINQHGVPGKMSDSGPLAKASFEKTTQQLVDASVFGEVDRIKGSSANIMFAQLPPGGTNAFDLVFDEKGFVKNLSELRAKADYNPIKPEEDPNELEKEIADLHSGDGDFYNDDDLDFSVGFDLNQQHKIGLNIKTPKVQVNII